VECRITANLMWTLLESNMRDLVITRITTILKWQPDYQFSLDITPDKLQSLSNIELLDLYEEILESLV
jgi:hypothetical protein